MTTPSTMTLEASAAAFLRALAGRNLSPQTQKAYRIDLAQFVAWLAATNGVAFPHTTPDQPYLSTYVVRDSPKDTIRRAFGTLPRTVDGSAIVARARPLVA